MRFFNSSLGRFVLTIAATFSLTGVSNGQTQSPQKGRQPKVEPEELRITECENDACGRTNNDVTWTFNGSTNGSTGIGTFGTGNQPLVLEHFDSSSIVVRRNDTTGPWLGSAVYKGRLHGIHIEGTVVYTDRNSGNRQRTGTWSATIGDREVGLDWASHRRGPNPEPGRVAVVTPAPGAIGQSGTPTKTASIAQTVANKNKVMLPIALYECDVSDCEAGAEGVWLFEENQGVALWSSTNNPAQRLLNPRPEIARLTIDEFDGHAFRLHRVDPPGSFMTVQHDFKELYVEYIGTVTGNTIEGRFHGQHHAEVGEKIGPNWSPDFPWHATIVNWDFCSEKVPCHLSAHQLSFLGRQAEEAKMYHQAFQCYVLAALQNDPDGEAGVAVMEMNGIAPGKKMPDDQIRTLLDDSALSDSYAALIGEREAFAQGLLGSKKDPENMKYWQVKADTWAVREKAGMHVPGFRLSRDITQEDYADYITKGIATAVAAAAQDQKDMQRCSLARLQGNLMLGKSGCD